VPGVAGSGQYHFSHSSLTIFAHFISTPPPPHAVKTDRFTEYMYTSRDGRFARFLTDSILSQVYSAAEITDVSEVLHSIQAHRIEESDESDENASHDDARQASGGREFNFHTLYTDGEVVIIMVYLFWQQKDGLAQNKKSWISTRIVRKNTKRIDSCCNALLCISYSQLIHLVGATARTRIKKCVLCLKNIYRCTFSPGFAS